MSNLNASAVRSNIPHCPDSTLRALNPKSNQIYRTPFDNNGLIVGDILCRSQVNSSGPTLGGAPLWIPQYLQVVVDFAQGTHGRRVCDLANECTAPTGVSNKGTSGSRVYHLNSWRNSETPDPHGCVIIPQIAHKVASTQDICYLRTIQRSMEPACEVTAARHSGTGLRHLGLGA